MIIGEKTGNKIKELHGVNCAPYAIGQRAAQPYIKSLFRYAGIPRSRLHDCCGSYGGTYFVDIPNIFRDFDADVEDPASYDFHYTDEYITAIINSGAQIVYRLGVTIEWGSKKYASIVPKDFDKWARICEHIVRHYNEGWAEGFEYNIEYWEIWNEPENPPMWQGTREQFYELYKVSSLHLRSCFPNIKIGGFGSCGFYAAFREGMSDFYKSFLPYFEDFLQMVKDNGCPLDFFTWHIYTDKVDEIAKSALYARQTLDKYGFTKTESHLNEWNYGAEGGGFAEKENMVGASFCTASLIEMQKLPVDLAQYYCVSLMGSYNGMMTLRLHHFTPVAHAYSAFNGVYRAENELKITATEDEPYAIASKGDDGTTHLLISTYKKECTELDITFEESGTVEVFEINDKGFDKKFEFKGNSIKMPVKDDISVYYFKMR